LNINYLTSVKTGQLNYVVIIVRNFQLAVIIKPAVGGSNFKFNMLNNKPYQSILEPVVKLNFLHISLIIFVIYIYRKFHVSGRQADNKLHC